MNERIRYSIKEKFTLVLAAITCSVMLFIYIKGLSLKEIFHFSTSHETFKSPIGKVMQIQGTVARQKAEQIAFEPLKPGDLLYPNDSIITGSNSSAELSINPELLGSKNAYVVPAFALVKLVFGTDFITGKIKKIQIEESKTQATIVSLKKPNKNAKVAPPPPPPPKLPPLELVSSNPENQSVFPVSNEEYLSHAKNIQFTVRLNRAPQEAVLQVFQKHGNELRQLHGDLPLPFEVTTFQLAFHEAGFYQWQVLDRISRRTLAVKNFSIAPEIEIIRFLPSINENNLNLGLSTKKEFEGFILRWSTPGAVTKNAISEYSIHVYNSSGKLVFQKQTSRKQLRIKNLDFLRQNSFFEITQKLAGGFLAKSPRRQALFSFHTPQLSVPKNQARIRVSALNEKSAFLYFTWSKLHYTDLYQFQISDTAEFNNILLHQESKDNFHSVPLQKIGTYYWRVRGRTHNEWTGFSEARSFLIEP